MRRAQARRDGFDRAAARYSATGEAACGDQRLQPDTGERCAGRAIACRRARARHGRGAAVLPAGTAGRAARRRDRRGDPRAPGGHRLRRDGLGQDDAAAQDLPRGRARRARPDRPHAAAAHRRARGRGAHRPGARQRRWARPSATRSASPTTRSRDAYIKLMTDGILLAETQGDRDCCRLRHDHRRRGARAQPQHRFPARLPEAAAAAAPRPQADHHLGDARRRALRAALRARRRARAGDRGVRADLYPVDDPLSAALRPRAATRPTTRRNSRRRSSRRPRTCGARARATSWCSCRASARSARPATCCVARSRAGRMHPPSRSCRSTRGCRSAEQQRVFAPSQRTAHRARDQRRRNLADGARASAT